MGLLDFLFPKYCVNCKKLGSYLCSDCFSYLSFNAGSICLVCGLPSIDGLTHPSCQRRYAIDGAFSSIAYKGVAKKLLYVFKYKPYVTALQQLLGDLFYEGLIQHEGFMSTMKQLNNLPAGRQGESIVLVPIPLHGSKLKSRGYNHAQILADQLSKHFNFPVISLLQRVKKTRSQYGLKRKERMENIAGAFSVSPNIPAPPAMSADRQAGRLISQYPNIFVVDDILTTGATLSEAAKVLKKAGAKRVFGLTLARD